MTFFKTKWRTFLTAVCCLFAICCIGGSVSVLSQTEVTASAETTYTVNSLTSTGGSESAINAYPNDGSGKPDGNNDWDSVYVLQSGSGTGMCLNGETLSNGKIKFPHDFYIELGKNAAEGDELTIDGTFSNAGRGITFIFKNCGLRYTNGAWVSFTPATKHAIGSLDLHGNSAFGAASTWNYALYLKRTDGQTLPFQKWDNPFTYKSGSGLKFNGESATLKEMQSSPDGLYLKFDAVSANTLVSIGGTFYCANQNIEYTIEESYFKWTGTGWTNASAPVQYTTYKIGKLDLHANSKSFGAAKDWNYALFLIRADEQALPFNGWENPFVYESGAGFKVNGEAATLKEMQSADGTVYLKFEGRNVGDIVTIGGTFVCEKQAIKYEIEECSFKWLGLGWEPCATPILYTTYKMGKLVYSSASEVGIYLNSADGKAFEKADDTWTEKWTFLAGSGVGVTYNGTAMAMNDIKVPGNLHLGLEGKTAKKGDVLVIGGTFYNDKLAVKYVIDETALEYNGTAWVEYVPPVVYPQYEIGALVLHVNSASGGAKDLNNVLYTQRADGAALPFQKWENPFTYKSGSGLKINGKSATLLEMQSTGDGLFIKFNALNVGDTLTIGGTFYCENQNIEYVIEESSFVWTDSGWVVAAEDYSDLTQGVAYDVVTPRDLDLGMEATISGIEKEAFYVPSAENTTGSMVFRFEYNSSNIASGCFEFRLRGTMWNGLRFRILDGHIETFNTENRLTVNLKNNTDYVIEIGAIDTADGNSIWTYITVDGNLLASELLAKSDKAIYVENTPEFGTFTTNCVGIYAPEGVEGTFGDPDHVLVTYKTDRGTFEEYANKAGYVVAAGKSYETFIGWWSGTRMYVAGEEVDLTESITLTEVSIRFTLEDGAAMRLASTSAESGIRFTSLLNLSDLNALSSKYGITVVEYGTLIMPLDLLGAKPAPNLDDFTEDEDILKIPSTKQETVDGNVVYRGAMQSLFVDNYDRLFAGRGYITLSFNGQTIYAYTPFDTDDNVRSIRFIAQKFMLDKAEYDKISSLKKEVVGAYAAVDTIQLTNYDTYKDYNVFNVMAWYYPELNPSNNYVNAENKKIADDMKNAGIKVVYLDGMYHLDLTSFENIEKTRQIINFFWSEGLYTIAFGSNNGEKDIVIDYKTVEYPDFSDCEGFIGFLVWDEPQSDSFADLAEFANNFEIYYAGSNATFMVNLLPSYASAFQKNSSSIWGGSTTLDKNAYKTYMQSYCDTVLSQVEGEKWLSLDSYPIFKDKSLGDTFLFDLAMLKYYSLQADATSHIVLQSSGWIESDNSEKDRMPTEAEMRMQAYAAMAFGIDSMSWWSYSDKREDNQQNPTDSDDYYTRFANVNNELASIGKIYKAFDWKGVILGAGKDNGSIFSTDNDYQAYKTVKGEIGDYELTAGDTKHLSSVSTNKTSLNYLMGVMQDMNGNEGYVLCNYNNHADGEEQKITLKFATNVTEVVIYRGGVAQTVAVSNKTATITLALGEGVIVLPSKLN